MYPVKKARSFKLKYEESYGCYVDDAFCSSKKNPITKDWDDRHWKGEKAWKIALKWIRSNVGTDADIVYRKFVTRINSHYSKDVRQHIHTAWNWYVKSHVEILNGVVYLKSCERVQIKLPDGTVFIHPTTKILSCVTLAKSKSSSYKNPIVKAEVIGNKIKIAFIKFILSYDKRIASGEFIKVGYPCWKKIVEKPYLKESHPYILDSNNEYVRGEDGGYLYETKWEISTRVETKVASKKDIKKYKLNKGGNDD